MYVFGMKARLACLSLLLLSAAWAAAQEPTDSLVTGALRNPEDEGLPWTYIVLVVVLVGLFFLLRRSRRELPSKRQRR